MQINTKNFKRAFQYGKPVFHGVNHGIQILLDFIYPPHCILCNIRLDAFHYLCPSCDLTLMNQKQMMVKSHQYDFPNLQKELKLKQVCTLWHFENMIEDLIHRVKYQHEEKLGEWLGCHVENQHLFFSQFVALPLIVPVPLHTQRHRERGYNQSEFIARGIQHELGYPISTRILKRIRKTRTQTALTAEQRQQNVEDAFRVIKSDPIQNRPILLVDDVITTGATMNQCAEVLLNAGSGDVYALALARPLKSDVKN